METGLGEIIVEIRMGPLVLLPATPIPPREAEGAAAELREGALVRDGRQCCPDTPLGIMLCRARCATG